MTIVLDREHARRVDQIAIREYGMSGLVLMENAGRGCAEVLLSRGVNGQVVVCCGAGNNGGDGFVIARHLGNAGVSVRVLAAARPEELSPDTRANYEILAKTNVPIHRLPERHRLHDRSNAGLQRGLFEGIDGQTAWIVDALLGTGFQGAVRPPFDTWIRWINSVGVPVLAVDLPSGLDCDTGQVAGECVRAAETCTFVALKPGFLVEPGRTLSGKVVVIDIGVPKEIIARVEKQQAVSSGVDFAAGQSENGD
jgi:NAD(P)H-hydrate epimerase